MISKKQALRFILLANFILLAHIAIPHHHHHLQICYSADACAHEQAAEPLAIPNADCASQASSQLPSAHSAASHSHPAYPDPANSAHHHTALCCLSEFVLSSSYHTYRLYPILPAASALHLPLFLLPENHLCRVAPVSLILAGPAPFPDSFYTSIASASIGLRAPPII